MTVHTSKFRTELNTYSPHEGLGTEINKTKNLLKAVYSFAVDGGAIGTISLNDDEGNIATLPDNAIVTRAWSDVVTTATSGGAATVSIGIVSTVDIMAATAVASVTGILEGIPDGATANMIKLAAVKQVKVAIAVAALTAGKINVYIEYVLSE